MSGIHHRLCGGHGLWPLLLRQVHFSQQPVRCPAGSTTRKPDIPGSWQVLRSETQVRLNESIDLSRRALCHIVLSRRIGEQRIDQRNTAKETHQHEIRITTQETRFPDRLLFDCIRRHDQRIRVHLLDGLVALVDHSVIPQPEGIAKSVAGQYREIIHADGVRSAICRRTALVGIIAADTRGHDVRLAVDIEAAQVVVRPEDELVVRTGTTRIRIVVGIIAALTLRIQEFLTAGTEQDQAGHHPCHRQPVDM